MMTWWRPGLPQPEDVWRDTTGINLPLSTCMGDQLIKNTNGISGTLDVLLRTVHNRVTYVGHCVWFPGR